MIMDQTPPSKTFRKALKLIEGGHRAASVCRKNVADGWHLVVGAHLTANDNATPVKQ